MTKAQQLKHLLNNDEVTYALEAHHAASALIVEKTGFKMIWASGLTLSAALGHRDCNELSWTNLCDQFEYMADATNIPILVDGDTGFGNFNNVRMLVRKLGKCGVAGVCLEDKIFPKTNSFLPYNQSLSSIEEFVGKIQAAKDSQTTPDFCVVARTEAFISGQGLEEALKRAYAYQEAGADAILVHSKKSTIEEIESFCKCWNGSAPLVIVPTKYASTPSDTYQKLGISVVLWANHLFRASLIAMRDIAGRIFREQSVHGIDSQIASLNDIFELVDENELKRAEQKYFPLNLNV
jgi:phosphoenolpyruvate phosphomutase